MGRYVQSFYDFLADLVNRLLNGNIPEPWISVIDVAVQWFATHVILFLPVAFAFSVVTLLPRLLRRCLPLASAGQDLEGMRTIAQHFQRIDNVLVGIKRIVMPRTRPLPLTGTGDFPIPQLQLAVESGPRPPLNLSLASGIRNSMSIAVGVPVFIDASLRAVFFLFKRESGRMVPGHLLCAPRLAGSSSFTT